MKTYRLTFAEITILDKHTAEVVVNEGVEFDLHLTEVYHDFLKSHLQPPFCLVINKVYSYTYTFEAQNKIANLPEIECIAVIAPNSFSSYSTKIIKNTRSENDMFKTFGTREEAIHWVEKMKKLIIENKAIIG
ncbi:MAG: hypothetical protein BM564_10550 [Bacteroidetes bacterium MedPE-SWsnd-G2]|nr:MAG: hypothetical protein BM564_10550 [Bacteroidetes bacterium MedPE-SWsnd-G2]